MTLIIPGEGGARHGYFRKKCKTFGGMCKTRRLGFSGPNVMLGLSRNGASRRWVPQKPGASALPLTTRTETSRLISNSLETCHD